MMDGGIARSARDVRSLCEARSSRRTCHARLPGATCRMFRAEPSQISSPRLLFLSPAAGLGGAERCLLDFVWACRRLEPKVEIRVISFAHGPLVEALQGEGAPVS